MTILSAANSSVNYPIIRIPDGARNASVAFLSINGGAHAHGARGADGILIGRNTTNIRVFHTEVYRAADNGIESNGRGTDIFDNYIHGNYSNGIYVIGSAMGRAAGVRVHHNLVVGNSVGNLPPRRPSWDGIDVDPITADCEISHNILIGNDIILFEDQQIVSESRGHRVSRNLILGSPENGIDVSGAVNGYQIAENRIYGTIGDGILLTGPQSAALVTGNTIDGATRYGIMVENHLAKSQPGAPAHLRVISNTIAVRHNYHWLRAIRVKDGAHDVLIEGNRIIADPNLGTSYYIQTSGSGLGIRENENVLTNAP
ncbi:MAG TPA: right-handed parallel beta-helix repeat-containing protein [Stellaceae bacterium]|nr:right-handed parallel beta-helix repeat-containing protein [Stellaceae bacterium]